MKIYLWTFSRIFQKFCVSGTQDKNQTVLKMVKIGNFGEKDKNKNKNRFWHALHMVVVEFLEWE